MYLYVDNGKYSFIIIIKLKIRTFQNLTVPRYHLYANDISIYVNTNDSVRACVRASVRACLCNTVQVNETASLSVAAADEDITVMTTDAFSVVTFTNPAVVLSVCVYFICQLSLVSVYISNVSCP